MGSFFHEQESFGAGEVTPHAGGRIRSKVYGEGVAFDENWKPLSVGSMLLRAGSMLVGSEAAQPRLIPFRIASDAQDYILAISDGTLRIYSRDTGALVPIAQNLITNGHFDSDLAGWGNAGAAVWQSEAAFLPSYSGGTGAIYRDLSCTAGVTYDVTFRVRGTAATGAAFQYAVVRGSVLVNVTMALTKKAQTVAFSFTAPATDVNYRLTFAVLTATGAWVDDVIMVQRGVTVTSVVAPWSAVQIPDVQWDAELAKNRIVLVHPNVQPYVLAFTAPNVWELYGATFSSQPSEWGDTNWPGVVEVGFQGRMWLGATPNEPNQMWASRSGKAFDFGTNTPAVPSDSFTQVVSTKGSLLWMRGQKALLAGSQVVEHSITGSTGGVIAPADIGIRDESAYGSAPVQAVHGGDQVLFVTRDRRHVRSLAYSLQDNAWVSRALTFLADHLTLGLIKEIHFARSPEQQIVILLQDGTIRACTYNRVEQVIAWWRLALAGAPTVNSAAVADGPSGSEIWLSVTRGGAFYIEKIPLHEVGVVYVDAAVSGVVAGDGTFGGLAHLNGQAVRVIVDGALDATDGQVVAGGQVSGIDVGLAGKSITVGLGYRPKAVQFPPEGGSQKGTAQLSKRRVVSGIVRVNDSAPPLVNGQRAGVIEGADRSPSTPMDSPEPRFTGDLEFGEADWDGRGVCTIEQDLPFRTEILAVYKVVNVQDLF